MSNQPDDGGLVSARFMSNYELTDGYNQARRRTLAAGSKLSSVMTFVFVMAAAAAIGSVVLTTDYFELNGAIGEPGAGNVWWHKTMAMMGVDVEEHRAERKVEYGSEGDFANESGVNDMQMVITDAMGPSDSTE